MLRLAASYSYLVTRVPLPGHAVSFKTRGDGISWGLRVEISLLQELHAYAAASCATLLSRAGTNDLLQAILDISDSRLNPPSTNPLRAYR